MGNVCYVYNSDGQVIQKSKNLQGIRRYVQNHTIALLSIAKVEGGKGFLYIRFEDDSRFGKEFESFKVLCEWVARWRSVYGSPLEIDGTSYGAVNYNMIEELKKDGILPSIKVETKITEIP